MKKMILAATAIALALASCGTKTADSGETTTETATHQVSDRIAFVRLDSLMNGYDMYNELSASFEAKAKLADDDLTSRGRALERKFTDAQTRMEKGLLTRAEAGQLQESLQRDEQSFMALREEKTAELAEENQVMLNKIQYSIEEYIAEFNADYRYAMILTTSGSAPILHADPALDITAEVLKGLNERYAKQKAEEGK
jgi:outer membrane protein